LRYVLLMATVGLLVFVGPGAAQSESPETEVVGAPQQPGTSARGGRAPGEERDRSPGVRRGGRLPTAGRLGGAAGARDRSEPRMRGGRGEGMPPPPPSGTRASPPVTTAGREPAAPAVVRAAVVVAIAAGVYLLFVLALLNWVRTRRFGVAVLGLSAISLVLWPALRLGTVSIYPIILSVMGLDLLLIRVWPRWRLLRPPLPRRLAPPVPAMRGVIVARRWPLRREKGMTVCGVLVGFSMVALVSAGAVSGIGRAVQVTASSRQSLVASALLEGEMERARAGAIPWERLEEDLAARARRLLPDAEAAVVVTPQAGSGVRQVDLVVSWRGIGKPPGRASLSGMVYALSGGEEQ